MADKHTEILVALKDAQEADEDNRAQAKEADLFLNKRDGQWEPEVYSSWSDRPRYTFDQVNPVVDGVLGEMDAMDFAISVSPNGAGATKYMADRYAGIVRMIENISKARYTYKHAARVAVSTGLAGWRLKTRYRQGNPFVQDIVIEELPNFQERVWFDSNAIKRTMEDAKDAWVLTSLSRERYEDEFPKGSGLSVNDNKQHHSYYFGKGQEVIIGEWYYEKLEEKEYAILNNGNVYLIDSDFDAVRDELFQMGLRIDEVKTVREPCWYQRLFDGGDFLSKSRKLPFVSNPIVPVYANWNLIENKVIYWGLVEKLMDPQRVLNYAESKKVAESALKPVEKIWMAVEQAESKDVKAGLATANVNSDPHQFYDHVDGITPPYKQPTSQPDQVLMETAASAKQYVKDTSNYNDAARGTGLSGQSGETIQRLQNKGNIGNFKYFTAMEIAIGRTAELIIDAIPVVYDTPQELNLINIDGTQEQFKIHDTIFDRQTNRYVTINNVARGKYQVTCSAGPAFQSKQQESARNMIEAAQVYPAIMEVGADIFLRALDNPTMEQVANRLRRQLLLSGVIPEDQMSKEEKQWLAEKIANQKPDPIAEANLGIAQAELKKAEAQTMDIMSKMKERQEKSELAIQKMLIDFQIKQQQLQTTQNEKIANMIVAQSEVLNTHADTLKKIREALGAQAIADPSAINAYREQADIINEAQASQ